MTDCFPLWQIPPSSFQPAQNSIHTVYIGGSCISILVWRQKCVKRTKRHALTKLLSSPLLIQLFFWSGTNERSERSMGTGEHSTRCYYARAYLHNCQSYSYMNAVISDYLHIQSAKGAINQIELDI